MNTDSRSATTHGEYWYSSCRASAASLRRVPPTAVDETSHFCLFAEARRRDVIYGGTATEREGRGERTSKHSTEPLSGRSIHLITPATSSPAGAVQSLITIASVIHSTTAAQSAVSSGRDGSALWQSVQWIVPSHQTRCPVWPAISGHSRAVERISLQPDVKFDCDAHYSLSLYFLLSPGHNLYNMSAEW